MNRIYSSDYGDGPLSDWRRNAVVQAMASLHDRPIPEVARALYGNEGPAAVLKAATTPASTTGWGSALAGQRVEAFLGPLRPRSAAAQLMEMGFRANMAGVGTVSLPRSTTSWPEPAFVGEGEPIPVHRGDLGSVILTPAKLAAIAALTNDLRDLSAEDAEAVITELMTDAAARSLDGAIFSTTAASAIRPAGILNGVAALGATAGGGINAFAGDVRQLVGAIHNAGGGANVVLIAAPEQAASASIFAGSNFKLPVVAAPNLAAGTVIAVEASAFASGFSDAPRVDIAEGFAVHFEDAAPLPLSTPGAPATVAAPVRSGVQQNLSAIRLVLRVAFAIRGPGLVQHVAGATW